MIAELICVGTELLMGQVTNTNARFISEQLAPSGIDIYYQTVIGDNSERLKEMILTSLSRSDTVILTGGLGPTDDDLTKETAADVFGYTLDLVPAEWDKIVSYFARSGRIPTENNRKQAMFPRSSIILPNPNGTAPGCIMEKNGKSIILLPGPPRELKPMFLNYVIPYLMRATDHILLSREVRIFGMGESQVTEKLNDLIKYQNNPTIASYALTGELYLRITAKCTSKDEGEMIIAPILKTIRDRLGDVVYSENGLSLAEVCHNALLERKETVAVAESCTGGLLASAFVDLAGSSDYFIEGAVTYSNDAKVRRLGVSQMTLDTVGPVSEQCAKEMAEGLLQHAGTTYALATTGIAGPGGGTDETPVGTVYVSFASRQKTVVKRLNLNGDRNRIRYVTVLNILDIFRRNLCT